MSTLVDRVVPSRLGPDARRFVGASWLVQLVDGIGLVAGPLAVASLTASPVLVALAVALHRLPVLLLGPWAAFVADLVNRRLLVAGCDAARAVVLTVLATLLALGAAPVALVLLVMVLLGVLETAADSARGPVLAMLVPDTALHDTAAARLDAGFVAGTQLLGPAVGALLFTVGPGLPFVAASALLGSAVVVLAGMQLAGPARGAAPLGVRRPVRAGLRRIAIDPPLSGLVLLGLAAQVAWAAGWSLLVLYAVRQLELGPVGFGLLVVAGATGGMAGVVLRPVVDRLVRTVRAPLLVLVGLGLEAGGHALLAVVHDPLLAGATVAGLGAAGFLAGDLARQLRRDRTAADGSDDVVAAACATLGLVATVGGCLLGGLTAAAGGITAAYAGAAAVLFVALAVLGRRVASL